MTIISQERKSFKTGDLPGSVYVVLYNATAPSSLSMDGEDIGLTDGDEIAVGSMLLTPEKRYIYGDAGAFVELSW